MHALLFEMKPREGHEDHYFRHAAALRPLLEQQDGLIFIDRFKSLTRPGVILSHSLWRDEASLAKWRTNTRHHKSQAAGRNKHFEDYRIRISHVLARSELDQDTVHWSRDGAYSTLASRIPHYLVIVVSRGEPLSDQGETFASVNHEGTYVTVADFENEADARAAWATAREHSSVGAASFCLISRDYGMFDRDEAPQYWPDVAQPAGSEN